MEVVKIKEEELIFKTNWGNDINKKKERFLDLNKYRELGQTNLMVSPLGLGGAALSGEGRGYGFGAISESDSIDLVLACFEQGINIFDVAPIYGFGLAEKRLGKALKKIRDQVVIVSKCGVHWDANRRVDMNNSPQVVTKMLEQSLRDLQSDFIDIYMVHWPDPRVDIRKTMEVLARAKEQQKIAYIGLSNFDSSEIKLAMEVDKVDVLQNEVNLLNQSALKELLPFAKEEKLGVMAYGTLGKGVLTGRVTEDRVFEETDARSWAPWWKKGPLKKSIPAVQQWLKEMNLDGITGLQLALAFNRSINEITTSLCGVRSKEQLNSLVEAYQNDVGGDKLSYWEGRLKEVLS